MSYKKLILFLLAHSLFLSFSQAVSYKKVLLCAAPVLTVVGACSLLKHVVRNSIKITHPQLDSRDSSAKMIVPSRPVLERAKNIWDRYGVFQSIDLDRCFQQIIKEHLEATNRLKFFTVFEDKKCVEYKDDLEALFCHNSSPLEKMKKNFPDDLVTLKRIFDDYSKMYTDFKENFKNSQGSKYKIEYKNGFYFSSLRMMASLSEHLRDVDETIAKLEKCFTQRECKENFSTRQETSEERAQRYQAIVTNEQEKADRTLRFNIEQIENKHKNDTEFLEEGYKKQIKKLKDEIELLNNRIHDLDESSETIFDAYFLELNAIFVWFFDTFGEDGPKKHKQLRDFIGVYAQFKNANETKNSSSDDYDWESLFTIKKQSLLKKPKKVQVKLIFEPKVVLLSNNIENIQDYFVNEFNEKTFVYDPEFKNLSIEDIEKHDTADKRYMNKKRLAFFAPDQNQEKIKILKNIDQAFQIYFQLMQLSILLQNSEYDTALVRFAYDSTQDNKFCVEYSFIENDTSKKKNNQNTTFEKTIELK